ncbi:tetrathionate reductase family octaheme c-type cytochrome [Azoarcus sp. KH32C]|uniref:tetrathionate reductase family octaheme c-type cytochrome n=1 Tax=Azoarcus sp. KH32C TaxID=748247 RepID=UPI0018D2BDDD|nr:tetrathionate reductase family octaheme c-type cytochrome [Azoarcus sp. KH32C]
MAPAIANNAPGTPQPNPKLLKSTADHAKFKELQQQFASSPEVTKACLVCHDQTGKYKKPSGFAGNPVTKDTEFPPGSGKIVRGINLSDIAQKVGKTKRSACGACHFYSGGGDGVKHGDLDSSLDAPEKALDVHMAADGLNFTCATCHQTEGHQVPGSRYAPTAMDRGGAHLRGKADRANPATCQSYGQTPHKKEAKLNDHSDKLACQTCHIPAFSRGDVPTKMSWDWSTAGKRDKDGKPLVVKNDEGHDVYLGIKGDFVYEDNVKPEYVWFNGTVTYTLADDRIDKANQPIYINRFEGSADDGKSMIWPIKLFRGKQPFDAENRTLTINHLAGQDDSAYWTNLNWDKAIAAGMAAAGQPYSGKYDFIETIGMWPITHMVAPKDKAVACAECHASNGRLEKGRWPLHPGPQPRPPGNARHRRLDARRADAARRHRPWLGPHRHCQTQALRGRSWHAFMYSSVSNASGTGHRPC